MARVDHLQELSMERPAVHEPVEASYTIFKNANGDTYLQIDTYGSSVRQIVGKKSQSVQFGPVGLRKPKQILSEL